MSEFSVEKCDPAREGQARQAEGHKGHFRLVRKQRPVDWRRGEVSGVLHPQVALVGSPWKCKPPQRQARSTTGSSMNIGWSRQGRQD